MKIGLDISRIQYGRGVSNYIQQLLWNFIKLAPENEYRLFYNSFEPLKLSLNHPCISIKSMKIPRRLLELFWLDFGVPRIEWLIGDISLFHSPAHSPVYAICPPAKRWVVTVHDLFTFKLNYAETTQRKELKILKRMEERASHVITVSDSTRRDLLDLAPSLQDRVSVIYEGVHEGYRVIKDYRSVIKKYSLNTPYLLYVGSADANKNIPRLLAAFKNIHKKIEQNLVLVGDTNWRYKPIIEWVRNNEMEDRILFTGFIPENDLPAVYNGADASVCPSLYEGFGLTVLEAMACGIPVVVSNVSSLPEIAGDTAVYCDPHEVDSLSNALLRVSLDSDLRKVLSAKGLERAKYFSWESAAKKTLDIYNKVLS